MNHEKLLVAIAAAIDKQAAVCRYHDAVIDELRRTGLLSRAVFDVLDEACIAVDRMDVAEDVTAYPF